VLGRYHNYTDLQQIQDELSPKILDLTPANCCNKEKIPYLSSRNQLRVRETVFQDTELCIEDVIDTETKNDEPIVTRQLKFILNDTVRQSEVPLINRNTKTSKRPITEDM